MARTTIAPQGPTSTAGLTPTYAAVDQPNGNQFVAAYRRVLHVKNTGGGNCTVTLRFNPGKVTSDGQVPADKTVTVPLTTGDKLIGSFPDIYTQNDGLVYVDWSTGTGVTAAVLDPG